MASSAAVRRSGGDACAAAFAAAAAASTATKRILPPRQMMGKWSRSLDDPMTFEEAIIAGRGTRQLPAIGPQQLLQQNSGRSRGLLNSRRELPRPGPSVDNNGMTFHPSASAAYLDSDEDEDWC